MDTRTPAIDITAGSVLSGKTIIQVAAGQAHSLALCSDGTVAAWGLDTSGQLGDDTKETQLRPINITTRGALKGKKVVQLAAGYEHSLALCADNTVIAWGANFYGQLGYGTDTNTHQPVNITGKGILKGKSVIQVIAAHDQSFALCTDGTVAAWGDGNEGQLGDGHIGIDVHVLPEDITHNGALNGKRVVQIAAGLTHALAFCSDGTVAAWGSNRAFQLGDNTQIDRPLPIDITNSGALKGKTVSQLAAGGYCSMALLSNGSIIAWGSNGNGELGDGTGIDRHLPTAIGSKGALSGKKVTALSAGLTHCLALCSDNSVIAWGNNVSGQLGDGVYNNSSTPIDISFVGALRGQTVSQLSARPDHSLAVGTANELPTIKIFSPSEKQQILLANFDSSTIAGDATDNVSVSKVDVKLYRTRNGVNQIWNGTAFNTASTTVPADLSGTGSNVTWGLRKLAPPQRQLDEGDYQLIAYATDAAGNQTAARTTFSLVASVSPPDTTRPTLLISAPTANQTVPLSSFNWYSFRGVASDNVGVAKVELKLYRQRNGATEIWNGLVFTTANATAAATLSSSKGGSWLLGSKSPVPDQLDTGVYYLNAYATDAAGNKTTVSITFDVSDTGAVSTTGISGNSF